MKKQMAHVKSVSDTQNRGVIEYYFFLYYLHLILARKYMKYEPDAYKEQKGDIQYKTKKGKNYEDYEENFNCYYYSNDDVWINGL